MRLLKEIFRSTGEMRERGQGAVGEGLGDIQYPGYNLFSSRYIVHTKSVKISQINAMKGEAKELFLVSGLRDMGQGAVGEGL